jgi:uncharacterized protein YjbJ (UPF0337 family)
MNNDQVKGAVNDAAGRVKRQVGEWTGDTSAQVEGAAQQVKGKAQKAWGNVKDAAQNATDSAHRESQTGVEREREPERQREAAGRRSGSTHTAAPNADCQTADVGEKPLLHVNAGA